MHAETKISEFLIFCSIQMDKSGERRKKDFYRWPSELPANQCRPSGPGGQIGRHRLAGNSKSHRQKSIFFLALLLTTSEGQNIKFSEISVSACIQDEFYQLWHVYYHQHDSNFPADFRQCLHLYQQRLNQLIDSLSRSQKIVS